MCGVLGGSLGNISSTGTMKVNQAETIKKACPLASLFICFVSFQNIKLPFNMRMHDDGADECFVFVSFAANKRGITE